MAAVIINGRRVDYGHWLWKSPIQTLVKFIIIDGSFDHNRTHDFLVHVFFAGYGSMEAVQKDVRNTETQRTIYFHVIGIQPIDTTNVGPSTNKFWGRRQDLWVFWTCAKDSTSCLKICVWLWPRLWLLVMGTWDFRGARPSKSHRFWPLFTGKWPFFLDFTQAAAATGKASKLGSSGEVEKGAYSPVSPAIKIVFWQRKRSNTYCVWCASFMIRIFKTTLNFQSDFQRYDSYSVGLSLSLSQWAFSTSNRRRKIFTRKTVEILTVDVDSTSIFRFVCFFVEKALKIRRGNVDDDSSSK